MLKIISLAKQKAYTPEHGIILFGASLMVSLYCVSGYAAYVLSLGLGT